MLGAAAGRAAYWTVRAHQRLEPSRIPLPNKSLPMNRSTSTLRQPLFCAAARKECCGGEMKTSRQRLNLAHIKFALTSQDFGDYPLAADFRQVPLRQFVLIHQKLQQFDSRRVRYLMVFLVVRLDQHAQRLDEAIARVPGFVTYFVHQLV